MLLIPSKKLYKLILCCLIFPLEIWGQSSLEVSHYDLAIAVNDSNKSISGQLTITSKRPIQRSVHSGLLKDFQLTSGFDASLSILDSLHAIINFRGQPKIAINPPWDGGFIWKYDQQNNPFIGVACQEDGPQIWWPAFDALQIRSDSMHIHLNVSDSLMGISNGLFLSKQTHGDGTATYHWKVSYPINNYNVSIYAGKYAHIRENIVTAGKDTLALEFYPLSYNENIAQAHFQQVKDMLLVYEELYGHYPFIEDGYKLVEAPYWGMEHQSAIAYGNHYQNNSFGFDFIIFHESAHEYWGNSVTMAGFEDLWIHETMATYTEVLYVERTQGKQQSLAYLEHQKQYIKNTEPIAGKEGQKKYETSDMYFKGSWMMHTLRNIYFPNDSIWFQSLKELYQSFKGRFIDREQFIEFWDNRNKKDLTPFFNTYLYQKVLPKISFQIKGRKLHYRFVSSAGFMPQISLKINGKTVRLKMTEANGTFISKTKIKEVALPVSTYLVKLSEDY